MADLRIVDAPVLLQESITDDVRMPTGGLGNYAIRLGDLVWYVVTKEQLASKSYVNTSSKGVQDKLDIHVTNKANPHQVTKEQVGLGNVDNTADIDKPISTSAESALSTKANKVDVYTKDETTGLINGIVTSNVSGHRGYLTLADAQAAQASLTSNTVVEVLADTDTTKNGIYLWDGTTLKKSTYDVLTTAKSYVDTNVKSLVGITNGINIADLSKVENGKYVDYTSGVREVNVSYSVLGMYEVEPNTEYKVPKEATQQFAFYDINKNYISGKVSPDAGQIFTTPSEAYFVAFTVLTSQVNSFMIAKSSEYPSVFTPYSTNVEGLKINTNQISDLISTVKNELGFYTINIVDTSKIKANTYVAFDEGVEYAISGFSVGGFYEIKPNTEYQVSDWYDQQFTFYDANHVYLSGVAVVDSTHKFVTPSNARYAKFTIPNDTINALVVAESALFPSSYIAYGQSTKDLVIVKNRMTEIYVSADLNDNDPLVKFKGKNAIQQAIDSITDASESNRYKVVAKAGVYKITQANEFIGYIGYPAMVCPKDFVDIAGQGESNTIVWAELPADDSQVGLSVDGQQFDRYRYQTIYNYAGNSLISDITFVAVNLRYTLHQDAEKAANKLRNYKNVSMIFRGNKGGLKPLGCGTYSGDETYYEGGTSLGDEDLAFSTHNNTAFTKPSGWYFKGHNFSVIAGRTAVQLQNDGSLVQDKFEMIGCTFSGTGYILNYCDVWLNGNTSKNYDSFNHAEWQVTGYGNEPFLFENMLTDGISLRIKSNTTGATSTVRFDISSSAYPILIKNNHSNAMLYTNKYDYVDNYIVQDGSVDLSGQAIGCLDVSAIAYLYNAGTNYTSLAKRLGNLLTSAKSLVVIVDGVTNTVTFNKDYNGMTNAQILAEINAQLTNATADFYNYGRDYYPLMTDVSDCVYNTGATFIPKGSIVTKMGGIVRLAQANDRVFGVALDDIPVMSIATNGMRKGQGRVLKRGYISADKSKAHFVLADNQTPVIGTRFAVSNGQLVTDSNGKISVDIDSGVVSINC